MNTLLVAVAARWEDRLRELLARRGHTFSIVDDSGKIGATLEQADYKLAFVGIGEAIGEAVESCRQLRACSGAKPLEILACGASLQSDKIQALLSAGVNDCLIDADNNAELDLRLALAEFRVSRSPASGAIQQPGIAPCDYGNSCDGASKGIFRSSLEGKFLDVSQSVVDMLGYKSREELLQIDLARDLYIDPLMRNQLLSELSAELKTHDILCKRRDGSPIVVRITWRRVFDDAGIFLYFEGTVQDISQSIRSPHLLGIRYNLAFKLSTTFDFQTTLDLILDALIQIEGIDCGGIYLFNDSSQQFELAAAIGIPEWFIQSVSQFPLDLPQTQYIMQGKSFYLPIEESQLINKSLFEREGIKTVAVVPIQHQGRVIATFNLGSRTQTEISLNARRSIEAIAIQVGGNVARAQSEKALHVAQRNMQSLFESLQDMCVIFDSTGRILHANRLLSERSGYLNEELLKMNITDLHPPGRYEDMRNVAMQIKIGNNPVNDIPVLAKDGTLIPIIGFGACGTWAGTDVVFGVGRDMTESRRTQLALHKSESRFRAIFESAAIGLALVDMNGKITEVNGALPEMLGYTPQEFIGMHYTEFTHPADIEYAESIIREMLDGKQDRVLFEKRFIHRNGGIVWGRLNTSPLRDTDGSPHYIIIMVENITNRKQAEDRLRENEVLLRGLFENLPDHVIVVDHNANILFANHDAPGLSKDKMIGEEWFGFIDAVYKTQCREAFADTLSTRKVQRVECLDVFNQFWSCAVVPFIYHDAVQQVMVICTDITEQKKAVEAIKEEQQLLRSIIDLHERDRRITAYEIHDGIAQQATASLFHLEAFQRLRESDQKSAERSLEIALKLISQSVDETRRLISGLRPLILDEYGIIEAIEYLVCENKERSGMQINFQHDVHFNRLAPPLESAVFRIVQEIVVNACHHSQSTVVSVELVERNDRLQITVSDQGIGFDPNSIEDTRSGLRSIRERARLLGGRAIIESAPGSGTSITVELPVVLQAEEKAEWRDSSDS